MKLSDYLILFVFIFAAFGLLVFYGINTESKAAIATEEYTTKLTAACEDAIKATNLENVEKNSLWSENSERNKTLSVFYTTLRMGFNTRNTHSKDEIKAYVPVVCLIDLDGYYISYNSAFDDDGNVVTREGVNTDEAYSQTMTVSPLNTWTSMVDNFIVQFYLNNYIKLTDTHGTNAGNVYYGLRSEVYKKIKKNSEKDTTRVYTNILKLLNDDKFFDETRADLITDEINTNITYYINNENVLAKDLDISYDYEIPVIKSEDWHRAITRPTCISFLQGFQMRTREEFVNVYSLAGGELIKRKNYFITQDEDKKLTYHLLQEGICSGTGNKIECEVKEGAVMVVGGEAEKYTDVTWRYNGIVINKFYNTMEECAAKGAIPCSCCKNLNGI